jgi:hypothetical protein
MKRTSSITFFRWFEGSELMLSHRGLDLIVMIFYLALGCVTASMLMGERATEVA